MMPKSRTIIALCAASIFLVIFLRIIYSNGNLIYAAGDAVVSPNTETQVTTAGTQLVSIADQTSTMLSGFIFALFVLIGFAFKSKVGIQVRVDILDGITGALFFGASFFALYLGYATRIQSLTLFSRPRTDLAGLELVRANLSANIGQEAFWVGVAAIPAIFLAVRFALTDDEPPKASTASPPETIAVPPKSAVPPPGTTPPAADVPPPAASVPSVRANSQDSKDAK